MTTPDSTAADLATARQLAAAALPGVVMKLAESTTEESDPDVLRKVAEALLKVATPPKEAVTDNRQVVNIVFQAGGLVQAEPVKLEIVEEVQPEPELLTDEPSISALDELLGAVNSALV